VRDAIGNIFKILGGIAFAIFGFWGFILELKIIGQVAGFWGFVIGLFVAPITFIAAPWYAGLVLGNWFPLLIGYGGGIVALILFGIGSAISRD
jgi:hypothetical protein